MAVLGSPSEFELPSQGVETEVDAIDAPLRIIGMGEMHPVDDFVDFSVCTIASFHFGTLPTVHDSNCADMPLIRIFRNQCDPEKG